MDVGPKNAFLFTCFNLHLLGHTCYIPGIIAFYGVFHLNNWLYGKRK
jgi:hypothetical protein